MSDLNITVIQTELFWEDIPANLNALNRKIDTIQDETDLIVLPEMFSTGFSMRAVNLAEDMTGSAVSWLIEKSRECAVDITGSLIIEDDQRYYNRLVWTKPDGRLFTYDKKHLFRMSGEEKVYHEGKRLITVELKGWRIRPFICYDLRFPAWTRNHGRPYDLAIFVANWPAVRVEHWRILLQARAIENQAYMVGVNRIGTDGNDKVYNGCTSVIDPIGHILFQQVDTACIHTATLSYDSLQDYRQAFPAWMDRDKELDTVFMT